MNNQSFPEDFDEIFEQTLDATYDGPVSELVLRRLLSAVELVIRQELARKAGSLGFHMQMFFMNI